MPNNVEEETEVTENGYTDSYDHIAQDFTDQKEKLKDQIATVESRQTEILNHIQSIESNINFLKGHIKTIDDKEQQRVLRGAISKNIELLAKLYQVYREFQDSKARLLRHVSDDNYRLHHLISVDIRRIDEKFSGMEDGNFFTIIKEMMNLIQDVQGEHEGKIPLTEDIQSNLEKENPEYKL